VPWRKRFSTDRIISIAALVVAAGAGLFSGLQYRAVSRQAKAVEDQVNIARQARDDATTSAKNQADDVKRAREAAEKSADAAQKLSNGMERSASAAEKSASAGREALALNRRALILSNQPNVVALNSRLSQQLAAGTAPEVNTQIANLGKVQPRKS